MLLFVAFAKRDMASAIARRRETRSHIALTKKVEDAYKRTIAKPQKANQLAILKAKKTRALTRAFTLTQKRGMKTLEKTSKKLGCITILPENYILGVWALGEVPSGPHCDSEQFSDLGVSIALIGLYFDLNTCFV